MIYLDNAATTKIYKEAMEARDYAENEFFANSSALHSFGMKSENLIKETKNIIASYINVDPDEIYFTKGATESNNIAISSFSGEKSVAVTTKIEHSSVHEAFLNNNFKEIIYLSNDEHGFIKLDDLQNKINDDVNFISIIYVNNETGTIQNIEEISKLLKDINKNIIIHIDITQALGKIDCNKEKLNADIMSFSAHKFHGPKGVGGLFIKKEILNKIKPILFGGNQQIISSGTDNHPAIYAMGKALQKQIESNEYDYIMDLNKYLRSAISENIDNFYIITPDHDYSPYILNVAFSNIKAEVLLHMLEDEEIYVSSGSACSKGKNNRILSALNVDPSFMEGAIRFSFSSDISFKDLDKTVSVLSKSIDIIREVM